MQTNIYKNIKLEDVGEKEFYSLVISNYHKRVKYFRNRVADKQTMWLMGNDEGFFTDSDTNGNEVLILWPYKEYAEYVLFDNKSFISELTEVEIHEFLENSIEYLDENNIKLMVFPTRDDGGALFEPNDFKIMMEEELARYGDYDDE